MKNLALIIIAVCFLSLGCAQQQTTTATTTSSTSSTTSTTSTSATTSTNQTTTTTTTSTTSTTLSGDIYYVSTTGSDEAGDGSASNPWASPGYGSRQLSAGDTLIILGGKYTLTRYDQDIITPQNSGSAGNPIVIRGESSNRPVLAGVKTDASYSDGGLLAAVDLNGQSYITIENLEIKTDDTVPLAQQRFRDGITGLGGYLTNIILRDLYLHHIDSSGINLRNIDTLLVENCTIEYAAYSAIASPDMSQNGGWKNILIDNCDLSFNGNYFQGITTKEYDRPDGIGLEEGEGPIEVSNCIIEHNEGDGIDLKLSNAYVHNNVVANNFADGIKVWSGLTTIENNVVYGVGDGDAISTAWVALIIDGASGETYFINNNTFHCNPERSHYMSTIQHDGRSDINLTMRNNIFSNSASTVYLAPELISYTIENNLFNRNGNTGQIEIGGSTLTVTQLNALANAANNTTGDPLFVSPAWGSTGDYQLQTGSPAIDTGTSEGTPSLDIEGNSRPTGNGFDIGAYEQ